MCFLLLLLGIKKNTENSGALAVVKIREFFGWLLLSLQPYGKRDIGICFHWRYLSADYIFCFDKQIKSYLLKLPIKSYLVISLVLNALL